MKAPSSPSSSQGITARTPDQFARKSVHNGRNPANRITPHSPKVTADQGLGSSSRKTSWRLQAECRAYFDPYYRVWRLTRVLVLAAAIERRLWRVCHAPPLIAPSRVAGVAVRTSRRLSLPPIGLELQMFIERRAFLASLAAVGATVSGRAFAQRRAPVEPVIPDEAYYDGVAEDGGFQFRRTNMARIAPRFRRQLVKYIHKEPPGSLVVDTKNHALYVTFENNTALRYGVGVGKEGFQWFGRAEVGRKAVWPDWTPPAEMLARRPDLPKQMKGGPDNPARAARPLPLPRRQGPHLPHPRHDRAVVDRHRRLVRLHPHAERGRDRPLPAHAGRHPRPRPEASLARAPLGLSATPLPKTLE